MMLNSLGIRQTESSSEHGFKLEVAEAEIEQALRRVVVAVSYPKSEILSGRLH